MIELVLAVLAASLLGSLHCAGMCGPFVALLARPGEPRLAIDAAYQGGRLASYIVLGAAAGALGAALDLSGAVFGLQRVALVVAGVGLVAFGAASVAGTFGVSLGPARGSARLAALARRVQQRAARARPRRRAALMGVATGLLPCGWLYAFVLTAAATGDATRGAFAMAAFWLGALPALGAVGAAARTLLGPLRRRAPALGGLVLIALGLLALSGRLRVPALSIPVDDRPALAVAADAADAQPACCDADG